MEVIEIRRELESYNVDSTGLKSEISLRLKNIRLEDY